MICIPWRIRLVLLFFGAAWIPSIYPQIMLALIYQHHGSVMGRVWSVDFTARYLLVSLTAAPRNLSGDVVAGLFPQGRVLLVCNEEDEKVIGGKLEDCKASCLFEFWDLRVWIAAYKKKHQHFVGFVQIPGTPIPRINNSFWLGLSEHGYPQFHGIVIIFGVLISIAWFIGFAWCQCQHQAYLRRRPPQASEIGGVPEITLVTVAITDSRCPVVLRTILSYP